MGFTVTDKEAEILLGATLMHWGIPFRFTAKHELTENEQALVEQASESLIEMRERLQQSKNLHHSQELSLSPQQIQKLRDVMVDCLAECGNDVVELGLQLKTRNKAEVEALVARLDSVANGTSVAPAGAAHTS
jgi:hypothetical protein